MKSIIIIILSIVICSSIVASSEAGWLIYHKPAFKGKIIDIETKEPIEGAVVVVIYNKSLIISGPAGGHRSRLDIREAQTDQNGEFNIPSYATVIQPLSVEDKANFIIYKPGYANIGELNMEGYFSGQETKDEESVLFWNKGLKFRLLASGVVELPRLRSHDERLNAIPSPIGEKEDWKNQKLLIKLINEEGKNLGIRGRYEIEEEQSER